MQQTATYLAIGLVIGLVSGALGIGGGVLMVPALMLLWGGDDLHFHKARGTSLAVLVMPVVLPGAWKYFRDNHVDVTAAICIAVAFAVGGYVGAALVQYLPAPAIRFGFGCMMLFLAMRYILSADDEASMAIGGLAALALALPAYWALRLLGRSLSAGAGPRQEDAGDGGGGTGGAGLLHLNDGRLRLGAGTNEVPFRTLPACPAGVSSSVARSGEQRLLPLRPHAGLIPAGEAVR